MVALVNTTIELENSCGYLTVKTVRSIDFRKKGENLATKEDIAVITREVERVRLEYAGGLENIAQQNRLFLEQSRQRHQLSLAVIDKRLEVNQAAYALFVKLWISIKVEGKEKVSDMKEECFEWWAKNCLYLSQRVRHEFAEVCLFTEVLQSG